MGEEVQGKGGKDRHLIWRRCLCVERRLKNFVAELLVLAKTAGSWPKNSPEEFEGLRRGRFVLFVLGSRCGRHSVRDELLGIVGFGVSEDDDAVGSIRDWAVALVAVVGYVSELCACDACRILEYFKCGL